jgi:hypothetical protein
MLSTFFVFDVESIGLHGEGFAVGWVVVDRNGSEVDSGYVCILPDICAEGAEGDRSWVSENVLPHLPEPTVKHEGVSEEAMKNALRTIFWAHAQYWTNQGASFWAECGCPVETNFLEACVQADIETRNWQSPYPLHEIASVMTAAGINPIEPQPRLESEEPKHHPTADARQSARLLIEALDKLGA